MVIEAPVDPDRSLVSAWTEEVSGPLGAADSPVLMAMFGGGPERVFLAAGLGIEVGPVEAEALAAGAPVSASCAPELLADCA